MERSSRNEPASNLGAAVVVLGASNVSRGLADLAAVAGTRQPNREASRLGLPLSRGRGRAGAVRGKYPRFQGAPAVDPLVRALAGARSRGGGPR